MGPQTPRDRGVQHLQVDRGSQSCTIHHTLWGEMGEMRVRGTISSGLTGCTDVVYHEIAGEARAAKH